MYKCQWQLFYPPPLNLYLQILEIGMWTSNMNKGFVFCFFYYLSQIDILLHLNFLSLMKLQQQVESSESGGGS